MIWGALRSRVPLAWKLVFRHGRARLLDPRDRGILVTIGGQRVRVPAYFFGSGRADYEIQPIGRFVRWLEAHPAAEVVDVGCSICIYGLVALNRQPQVTVVGLDPDLVSLKCAQWLCSKSGAARLGLVHGFAVPSDGARTSLDAALAATARELTNPRVPRIVEQTRYRELAEPDACQMPRYSLDALWAEAKPDRARLLKIDVEGFELSVLAGAREFLARCRPTILLSAHPQFFPRLGTSTDALRAWLAAAGYATDVFAVDHEEHWWCEPTGPQ